MGTYETNLIFQNVLYAVLTVCVLTVSILLSINLFHLLDILKRVRKISERVDHITANAKNTVEHFSEETRRLIDETKELIEKLKSSELWLSLLNNAVKSAFDLFTSKKSKGKK